MYSQVDYCCRCVKVRLEVVKGKMSVWDGNQMPGKNVDWLIRVTELTVTWPRKTQNNQTQLQI